MDRELKGVLFSMNQYRGHYRPQWQRPAPQAKKEEPIKAYAWLDEKRKGKRDEKE